MLMVKSRKEKGKGRNRGVIELKLFGERKDEEMK